MLKYGSNNIGKVYLGGNSIGKAYLGSNLVFQKNEVQSESRVEYLSNENNLLAYIDTGVQAGSTIRLIATVSQMGEGTCCGSRYARNNSALSFGIVADGHLRFDLGDSQTTIDDSYIATTTPKKYEINAATKEIKVNDIVVTTATDNSFSYHYNILLFGLSNAGVFSPMVESIRFHGVQIYDGETLVRDFVPYRVGSVGYMKDLVSGDLFANEGSGAFVCGPDIMVPEFHDYLVFDGTAFIDTDITVLENCSVTMGIGSESSRRQMRVFRVNPGSSDGSIYFNISSFTSSVRALTFCYDGSSGQKTYNTPTGSRVAAFLTPLRCGFGNQTDTYTKGSSHPLGGISIGGYTGDTSTSYYHYNGSVAYVKIWGSDAMNETSTTAMNNNHTPIITLMPCTCNGEAGLWHVEGNRFYGNTAGAGTLSVADNE